ncbi:MAG: nucleotidyltransferase domain-containing protein [Campylobacterales bacterium]
MRVRLKQEMIEFIKRLSFEIFNSKQVWIFGSRADMSRKGGDIDIYLETSMKDNLLSSKIAFLREFEKRFGEQKVDLIINNHQKEKSIFKIAKKEGVKL